VSAVARGQGPPGDGPFGRGGRGGPPRGTAGPSSTGGTTADEPRPEESGYAPTYYPGVDSIESARAVTVGLSAEALGIDFSFLLVRTSKITGRVTSVDGAAVSTGIILLTPEGLAERPGQGTGFRGRIQWDGAFSLLNVPPGRYVLRARCDDWDVPRFASIPLTVASGDFAGISLVVAPGATISGAVSFRRSQLLNADPAQFRIVASSQNGASVGPAPTARIGTGGAFTLDGIAAGEHWIRAQTPRGWVLQAVTLDGRDITDTPLEVRSGQRLANVQIVFSDKLSEISGTLTDDQGTPISDYTVLAFPTDPTLWRPQARHIMTTRPDQKGTFQLRGLPSGEYLVTPIDPAEQGEWFEPWFLDNHRTSAARVVLADGEVKTQNFTIPRP
jgi:hypothetical protein